MVDFLGSLKWDPRVTQSNSPHLITACSFDVKWLTMPLSIVPCVMSTAGSEPKILGPQAAGNFIQTQAAKQ